MLKRPTFAIVILVVAVICATFLAARTEAAQPPRVQGQSCGALARAIGAKNVWRTFFRAYRDGPFDQVWWTTQSPCFRTQADCKAWLYWAQTDWPKYSDVSPCRRGVR